MKTKLTDGDIAKIITDAKIFCVHPEAATTLDIARAIERHLTASAEPQEPIAYISPRDLKWLMDYRDHVGSASIILYTKPGGKRAALYPNAAGEQQ